MLVAAPAAAQHSTAEKKPAATKPEAKAEAKPEAKTAATPAEKPAAPKPAVGSASAAERILRRLDTEFPYKKTVESSAVRPKSTTGTSTVDKASKRVQLSWRLSLVWPDTIAPKTPSVGSMKLVWR